MKEHCKELAEKFSEYLDGEACDEDCRLILEHIKECDHCRQCMESLSVTREMLQKLGGQEMPDDLKDRLKACLKKLPE